MVGITTLYQFYSFDTHGSLSFNLGFRCKLRTALQTWHLTWSLSWQGMNMISCSNAAHFTKKTQGQLWSWTRFLKENSDQCALNRNFTIKKRQWNIVWLLSSSFITILNNCFDHYACVWLVYWKLNQGCLMHIIKAFEETGGWAVCYGDLIPLKNFPLYVIKDDELQAQTRRALNVLHVS